LAKQLLLYICLAFFVVSLSACSKTGSDSSGQSFSLADTEGQTFSLGDYRGKVVVLEFFTTWCEPCRISAPLLQDFSVRYKDRGVAIIAVSLDEGSDVRAKLKTFRERYKISYRIVLGNADLKRHYNAYVLPTTIVIDRNGIIARRHHGISRDYANMLAGDLEQLIRK
jgi:cytochrome c biogenesis protein CcmG, thiol:disulfide interchange protein DsbE